MADSTQGPDLKDIGDQLKELGKNLKELFDAGIESEKAERFKKKVNETFSDVSDKGSEIAKDAKSGKLEKDLKEAINTTLESLNKRLKEYSEDIKKQEP